MTDPTTAATDGAYTLFVADVDDTDTAWEVYRALQALEDGGAVALTGLVVVARAKDGSLAVQRTGDSGSRRGLTWGLVGGAVLGVLFPPSLIASTVTAGALGAALGKAREVHHGNELAEQLDRSIIPGHAAIVALAPDPGAAQIRQALRGANLIVESSVDRDAARDIQAAAKAAGGS